MDKGKDRAGKKKKKSGVVTRFLVISLVLLFIFAIAGIALLYWVGTKAIEEAPLQPQIMAFTAADVSTAFCKIQPIGSAVMQSHPDQINQLVLTTAEVNALLGLVNNAGILASVSGVNLNLPQNFNFRMENGCFWFSFCRVIHQKNPFGRYLNLQIAVEPLIRNGKINYRIMACRVGELDIPAFALQKYMEWEAGNNSESAEMIKKAVIDFYVTPQGVLYFKFYPFQLRQILMNHMKKKTDTGERN